MKQEISEIEWSEAKFLVRRALNLLKGDEKYENNC
jgi:hypothetical protein